MEQKNKTCQLYPFDEFDDVKIFSQVFLIDDVIALKFTISDPLSLVLFNKTKPNSDFKFPRNDLGQRKMNLWEDTCFELFLGSYRQSGYLEFNVSGEGDWNVFLLADYRSNLEEMKESKLVKFNLDKTKLGFEVNVEFQISNLNKIFSYAEELFVNLTVVTYTSRGVQYYAKNHPEAKPDFHNKTCWISL